MVLPKLSMVANELAIRYRKNEPLLIRNVIMASTFLSNIMRMQPISHNAKLSFVLGTVSTIISLKTYDATDFSTDSPLLLRMEDLSTQEHVIAVPSLTIDALDTFGLPDNISEPGVPLYIGSVLNGAVPELVVSLSDSVGSITTTTTATSSLSNLSTGVYTGKVLWVAKLVGWKRALGVWDFTGATLVYG
jgi:hypothetical protein